MINFPITIAQTDGTAIGTFYVGAVKSAVRGNSSLYRACDTYRPTNSGLKSILASICTVNNTWSNFKDCYVGTSVNESNKLGFKLRAYKNVPSSGTPTYNVYLQDRETGCMMFFYFPDCDNAQKDIYLCLPFLGEEDMWDDTSIDSLLKLRIILSTRFKIIYSSKSTDMWKYGMQRFNTAVLVAVMHDGTRAELYPTDTERPMYDLGYDFTEDRGFYHNLSTFWNWFHFMTGKFALNVQYVTTLSGRKIYLSKSIAHEEPGLLDAGDHLYKDGNTSNTDYYQYTDAHNKPCYAWDYQSGTDLRLIAGTPGAETMLSNGATIRCRKLAGNNNRYYYYYEVERNTDGDDIIISAAFNARREIGDLVGVNYTGNFSSDDLYEWTGNNTKLCLQHVGLWVSPKVEGGVEAYVDDYSEFGGEEFWNTFTNMPITIAGVYMSNWNTASDKYAGWQERAEAWGKSSTVTPLMVSNISGYVNPDNTGYNQLINLFSTINVSILSPIDISAFTSVAGGKAEVNSAENTKLLWGISDVIDPDIPDSGSGSIGGGGGGSHSGGGGDFDDEGDNVTTILPQSFTAPGTLVNYYIGELNSTELDENMTRLSDWFKVPVQLSTEDLTGLFYKYSDKLGNICSIKALYTPEAAPAGGWSNIQIHGQDVRGAGLTSPIMRGKPVTGNMRRTWLMMDFYLKEYFGSFLDYGPYTKIHIYLPFAGVHELDPSDIVGKKIDISCSVNYMTGDIVYNLTINTGTCTSVLYTFTGNCAVELPLTADDYGQVVSGLSKTLVGIAAMASNPALGALGAVGGLTEMTQGYSTSTKGSIGGTAGAMSPLKPYLIVTRPKMVKADDYGNINGYPCMKSYRLNELEGFIKVSDCHWSISGATEEELDEIDNVMKNEGAIL